MAGEIPIANDEEDEEDDNDEDERRVNAENEPEMGNELSKLRCIPLIRLAVAFWTDRLVDGVKAKTPDAAKPLSQTSCKRRMHPTRNERSGSWRDLRE